MKRILIVALAALLLLPIFAHGQVIFPNRGGTGTTTIPSLGQVLVGQTNGTYAPQATSTLGISGGSGSSFSTTSADYWDSTKARWATTSSDYWLTTKSTTNLSEGSNLYYTTARVLTYLDTLTKGYFFSTTSADYWDSTKARWATTSSDYWETQQTARTADDLTNNSIEDLSDVGAMTESIGDLFSWTGSVWSNVATGTIGLLSRYSIDTSSELLSIVTDETGTGNLVFNASPTFTGTAGFASILGTGSSTIASLTVTNGTTTNGTSTNFYISNSLSFGGVVGTAWANFCTSITGSADLCDGNDATGGGGGSGSNWANFVGYISPSSTVGITVNSSSSVLALTSTRSTTTAATTTDIFATRSSTTNATSTNSFVSGQFSIGTLSGLLKATVGVVGIASAGVDYLTTAVTSFNGQTGASQTLATTSNAGGWGFSSGSNIHTLNIPDAASTTDKGLLSGVFFKLFAEKVATTSIDTSAEVATLVSDETGSGALVFAGSPTFTGTVVLSAFTATNGTSTSFFSTVASSTNLFSSNAAFTNGTTSNATSTNLFVTNLIGTNATITNATTSSLKISGLKDNASSFGTSGQILQTSGAVATWVSTSTLGLLSRYDIDLSAELLAIVTDETGTGALVFADGPTFTGTVAMSAFTAVNGTSTSLFATVASSTNLFSSNGTFTNATITNATTTNLKVSVLVDSASSLGTTGMVLQTNGATAQWVSTSSLNISGGGGGSSKWTDSGLFTYLTDTPDDIAFGSSATATAPFWWDVSATTSYIGNGGMGDSVVVLGATNNEWSLGYDATDSSFAIASSTVLGTNNVITILKGGNTGIASSTPLAKLSVGGDAYIGGNFTATGTTLLASFTAVNGTSTSLFATVSSSTNHFSSNATTTSLSVLSLSAADCDVKANTNGGLYCGTDANSGGGGSPGGSDTNIQYNKGGAFRGIANLSFDDTTGQLNFYSASTTGTSTPIFHIATSSSNSGTSLFKIFATTTKRVAQVVSGQNFGFDSGARIVFGAMKNALGYPYNELSDNFTFFGTMRQVGWKTADCPVLSIGVALAADIAIGCPGWVFQEDNTATLSSGNISAQGALGSILQVGVGVANNGGGIFLGSSPWLKSATNTPIIEGTWRHVPTTASTTKYYFGFSNVNPAGTTFEAGPTAGCYTIASTTSANITFVTHNGSAITATDTGIASSTSVTSTGGYYRYRIEMDSVKCTLKMQETPTAAFRTILTHTTNIASTTALSAGVWFGNLTGGGTKNVEIVDLWATWRDFVPGS